MWNVTPWFRFKKTVILEVFLSIFWDTLLDLVELKNVSGRKQNYLFANNFKENSITVIIKNISHLPNETCQFKEVILRPEFIFVDILLIFFFDFSVNHNLQIDEDIVSQIFLEFDFIRPKKSLCWISLNLLKYLVECQSILTLWGHVCSTAYW